MFRMVRHYIRYALTSLLPLMADLMSRLEGLPLTPQIAWPVNSYSLWSGIGLGDVLLSSVFPLIMHKAFGRLAGIMALLIGISAIATIFIIPFEKIFPAMVVLGPLMVLQYIYWCCRQGQERTMWQYWQAETAKRLIRKSGKSDPHTMGQRA